MPGALAGNVDQVRAGVVVGAVGADVEVEIAIESKARSLISAAGRVACQDGLEHVIPLGSGEAPRLRREGLGPARSSSRWSA